MNNYWRGALAALAVMSTAVADELAVDLNVKKWHVGFEAKSCTLTNVDVEGRTVLQATFRKKGDKLAPEARISFVPMLNLERYSKVKLEVRASRAAFEAVLDWSSMEFWVMLQQMWDPSRNVEELRKYYIRRTFREAAPEMEQFYGALRADFYANPMSSTLGDSAVTLTKRHIIDSGLEEPLRAHLDKAAAVVKHPVAKTHIENVRKAFERNVAEARAIKTPTLSVPLLRPEGEVGFDSKLWNGAAVIGALNVCGAPARKAENPSQIRLFHDSFNLWLKFVCDDKDIANVKCLPLPPGAKEAISEDDHLEIFIGAPQSGYYQFSVNPENKRGDGRNYDGKWNGAWSSSARIGDGKWEAVVKIPLSTVNCDIAKNNTLKAGLIREYSLRADGTPREYSAWGGASHHRPETFGSLFLMK